MTRSFTPKGCRPRSRRSAASRPKLGVDVINDGEFGKASLGAIDYGAWSSYAWARLTRLGAGRAGPLAGARRPARPAEICRVLRRARRHQFSVIEFARRAASGVHRPDRLYRPAGGARRSRELQGGTGQGDGGGGVHHRRRARQLRPAAEPVLRLGRGVPVRPRRGVARGIPGHRRGGVRVAARRPRTAGHLGHGQPGAERRGLPQICRIAGRGAEPRVARPPRGADPLSHLLGQLARAAYHRPAAEDISSMCC